MTSSPDIVIIGSGINALVAGALALMALPLTLAMTIRPTKPAR